MTVTTYGTVIGTIGAKAKSGKGFWARAFDRFVEARMRQVEREIRNHARLLPEDTLTAAGYRGKLGAAKDLPFVN